MYRRRRDIYDNYNFNDVFNDFSMLGSDEAWLQAHVVNDRSVIKQNMDMESYTLSSTADDEGKFQPICKYINLFMHKLS